jgi:hypothetical protein
MVSLRSVSSGPDHNPCQINAIVESVTVQLITEPAKKPRKLWRKPRKLKDTPQAWLRRMTCPFDFGLKVKDRRAASSHPVHANRNTEILAAFRDKTRWRHVARLTNRMLDEHWGGRETYYFVAAGSSRVRKVLINLDIDCHNSGSLHGAVEAAEYLKQNFFPGLYYEVSTNGNGVHGYIIVEKFGIYAETLKTLLKQLEHYLNRHLLARGFDVELFEFKGLPPVVTWGGRNEVTNFTSGVLAKVPREVHRYEEWKQTTVVTDTGLRRILSQVIVRGPSQVTITPKPAAGVVKSPVVNPANATAGSTSGKVIGEDELVQLGEGGRYHEVAAALLDTHVVRTSGRSAVAAEDVAIFLLCLRFLTGRMNEDGTMPTRRFEGLWSALYRAGDVGRSFDCHRYKAIRDYLSDLGLLNWEDCSYVAPRVEAGQRRKGRACKWRASDQLMEMLKWDNQGQDEPGLADAAHKEGEGEAPLVGTDTTPFESLPVPVVTTIRSLVRTPEGQEVRPVEEGSWRMPTPEEMTFLVLNYDRLMVA